MKRTLARLLRSWSDRLDPSLTPEVIIHERGFRSEEELLKSINRLSRLGYLRDIRP